MTAFPMARIGDLTYHDPATPSGLVGPNPMATPGTVMVEGKPAASAGSLCACSGITAAGLAHPPIPGTYPIASGSATVTVQGFPAARWAPTDLAACGAMTVDLKLLPFRTVLVG